MAAGTFQKCLQQSASSCSDLLLEYGYSHILEASQRSKSWRKLESPYKVCILPANRHRHRHRHPWWCEWILLAYLLSALQSYVLSLLIATRQSDCMANLLLLAVIFSFCFFVFNRTASGRGEEERKSTMQYPQYLLHVASCSFDIL